MGVIAEDRARRLLADYEQALAGTQLSPGTRRAYASRIGGYLRWLAGPEIGGSDLGGLDPLDDPATRARAVREYRSRMTQRAARPTTVNATLTAIDHFHAHSGLGPVEAPRVDNAPESPAALSWDELGAFHGAVGLCRSPRDRAIALVLVDTGVLASELVALDVSDLRLALPRPRVAVRAREVPKSREVPMSATPRATLLDWLADRDAWSGADRTRAVFLNRRGERLSTRWVTELVVTIGQLAGIARAITPALLRRTFATHRLAAGADPRHVAELMGHKRLQTTNAYRG